MANVLKHRFVSAKANGADATQVQPSHWNDGHGFVGGNAGEFLTRDPTDASFGAKWTAAGIWYPYTPVWSTTVDPQPYGHAIAGRYMRIGATCHFNVQLTLFGGSGFGAGGLYQISLPIAGAWGSQEAIGSAYLLAGLLYAGTVANNGPAQALIAVNNTGNWWSPGVPVSMAPGHVIKLQGVYELTAPALAEELTT